VTQLRRELGVFGAIMMGLGAILGTGVFVSIGIASGITGASVILAIAVAAGVAICNALNSAQLAANYPVSGGTYEYGYRYINHWFGFSAGWMFLLAKSASAATAALGFAGYLLNLLNHPSSELLVPIALVTVVIVTMVVLSGLKRSNTINILIVSVTVTTLTIFVITGLPTFATNNSINLTPFFNESGNPLFSFLQATALMFVAYTGYGRIATLSEEVREPRKTIPQAIIITLIVTMILYMGVAIVGIGAVGSATLSDATQAYVAPLEIASRQFNMPIVPPIIALGAMMAMLGVLLNLILGLSRVLLAMGRRQDMPTITSKIDPIRSNPYVAVIVMGVVIAGLVLIGNVKTTWAFSAFTVLIYYSITNLAALRLSDQERLYPKWLAWVGLCACLFLAFWVDIQIWLIGLGLLAVGLIWHAIRYRLFHQH